MILGSLDSLCRMLLPIAPVVCRLTMGAIVVWLEDTPVGSLRQSADFVGQWHDLMTSLRAGELTPAQALS